MPCFSDFILMSRILRLRLQILRTKSLQPRQAGLLHCFTCYSYLERDQITKAQKTGRRSYEHSDAVKRLCISCGFKHKKWSYATPFSSRLLPCAIYIYAMLQSCTWGTRRQKILIHTLMASKFVNGISEIARLNAGRTLVMKSMQYVSGQQRVSSTTFMGVFGVVEILLAIQRLVLTEASPPQRPHSQEEHGYTWERPNANHTL
jgi:hypothetical protein